MTDARPEPSSPATPVVIDTNVLLDAFVWADASTSALRDELDAGRVRLIATAAMRAELARVLDYPNVARARMARDLTADAVLARFDRCAESREDAPRAPVRCSDPDDQKFIDLAYHERCLLLSRDDAVLSMARRLGSPGARIAAAWPPSIDGADPVSGKKIATPRPSRPATPRE